MGATCCEEVDTSTLLEGDPVFKNPNHLHTPSELLENPLLKRKDSDSARLSSITPQSSAFPEASFQPTMHPKVQEIVAKLGPFKESGVNRLERGQKEERSYVVNAQGLIYAGGSEWKQGLPHGFGKLVYPDGSIYEGYFKEGTIQGEGRFINIAGWWYSGEIFEEQANGIGCFYDPKSHYSYEGEWRCDLPDGKGKEAWLEPTAESSKAASDRSSEKNARLIKYEGDFVDGKKQGQGKYTTADWTYMGPFNNNEPSGEMATIVYASGEKYVGACRMGKKHGRGVYTWPNGSRFEGAFVEDEKEGLGVYVTEDGKVFKGTWLRGKRNGRGELRVGDKEFVGEWKDDCIVNLEQLI